MTSHKVMSDYSNLKDSENIKVFIRLRPPANGKEPTPNMFEVPSGNGLLTLRNPKDGSAGSGGHKFKFDATFAPDASQEQVFKAVAEPLVSKVLNGFNACCFAYGQTGSGKTHSIYGSNSQQGIIPRCIKKMFWALKTDSTMESSVTMCVLEIYCDNIRDLGKAAMRMGLDADNDEGGNAPQQQSTSEWYASKESARKQSSVNLSSVLGPSHKIYEDASGRVMIKDAEFIPATDTQTVLDTIKRCFQLRATHKTKMNDVSSRSHTVVIFRVTRTSSITGQETCSDLNLIDLAGSERVLKSEATGQRLKEALSINTSLSALGKVILALDPEQKTGGGSIDNGKGNGNGDGDSPQSPRGHNPSTSKTLSNLDQENFVPYRDSKLTRILQNSLGGNSFTTVLATVHPLGIHYEECLSTLLFAAHCRRVSNAPVVNRKLDVALLNKTLLKLRKQVKQLNFKITVLKTLLLNQTADIMAQLGIKGEVLPDGRFRLEDGRIVGTSASSIEAALGDDTEDGSAALRLHAPVHAAVLPAAPAASAEATRRLLHDQRSQFQKKLDRGKDKLADAKQQLELEREQTKAAQADYIGRIDSLNATVDQLSRALQEQQSVYETRLSEAQKSHEENIKEFVNNQLALQATQRSSATSMAAAAAAASGGRLRRLSTETKQSSFGGRSSGLGAEEEDFDDEEEDFEGEFVGTGGGGWSRSSARGEEYFADGDEGAGDFGAGRSLMHGRHQRTTTTQLTAPRGTAAAAAAGRRRLSGSGRLRIAGRHAHRRHQHHHHGGGHHRRQGHGSSSTGSSSSSSEAAIAQMKQQFEHWMHKRSHEISSFVDQLNKFYAHKKRQVQEYRTELSQVYAHCSRLAAIVRGFQQGRYGRADFNGLHPLAAEDINSAEAAFDDLKRLKYLRQQEQVVRAGLSKVNSDDDRQSIGSKSNSHHVPADEAASAVRSAVAVKSPRSSDEGSSRTREAAAAAAATSLAPPRGAKLSAARPQKKKRASSVAAGSRTGTVATIHRLRTSSDAH